MNVISENEGRRLFLYHLTQTFLHEKGEEAEVECVIENGVAQVRITLGEKKGAGEAELNLKLHKDFRRAENAAIGIALGRAAKAFSSYAPPYGTLIGVRPVKVPVFYLENGFSEDEVTKILEKEFLVSEDKARLLLSLAKTERDFQEDLSQKDALLYVSIPFCPTRCSYCSFISSAAPNHLKMIPDYLRLLQEEIRLTAKLFREEGRRLRAVYVGGGTPGILKAEELDELLECIRGEFDTSVLLEFSVEMGRPDTVTKEKLEVLKHHGVDRISINSQTTCDETLKRIGRSHSTADFFAAMEMARPYPFRINCDLISALPGEDPETFLRSVKETLAAGPKEITLHALCRKKSASDQEEKAFSEEFRPAVNTAHKLCINAGMAPYYLYRQKMSDADMENLGFSTIGEIGIYNLAMMEDLCDVFACGAGGISKLVPKEKSERIRRFAGFKYPFEYLSHPEKIQERLEEMKG